MQEMAMLSGHTTGPRSGKLLQHNRPQQTGMLSQETTMAFPQANQSNGCPRLGVGSFLKICIFLRSYRREVHQALVGLSSPGCAAAKAGTGLLW